MRFFGREFEGFAKWLVLFVMALLIAGGLCGLQLAILSAEGGHSDPMQGIFMVTGALELIIMLVSAAGAVAAALALLVSRIFGIGTRSREPVARQQISSEDDAQPENHTE